jgi:hypothetical protein
MPLAAIRYDLPGLITSLSFFSGTSDNNEDVVVNALFLDR